MSQSRLTSSLKTLIDNFPDPWEGSNILFVDLETQSELDLRTVGTHVYAQNCNILCMSYATLNGPTQRWVPGMVWPDLSKYKLVAHNCEFEYLVLQQAYPRIQWLDTAAIARSQGLPGKLEDLGAFLGFEKDMEGNRVMMKLSKPRRPSKTNPDKFWTPETKPEDFERLYQYCDRDVEVMREAWRALYKNMQEEDMWRITWEMNERGVKVDLDTINALKVALQKEKEELVEECVDLCGFTPYQVTELARWCRLPNMQKATLRDAMKMELSHHVKRVITIRQTLAKTSVKKLDAFINRTCPDGRYRGALIAGGAERTMRWSGVGVQLQNLPRGFESTEEQLAAIERIKSGEYHGAHELVSQLLRGLLVGSFLVGDYAQIEARVLVWLAGQDDMLSAFAEGKDPYKQMAARIYHKPVEDVNKKERFMGKQAVLGAGYGLGHVGFRSMLDLTYDVQIGEQEAERIIKMYRAASPKVKRLWRQVENAFKAAWHNPKIRTTVGPLKFGRYHDRMWVKLPSGRRIWYWGVDIEGRDIHIFGRNQHKGGKWEQVKTYGGKLVENIVQAIARDIMAEAIRRLYRAGYPLVLTVHDEIVSEILKRPFEAFIALMEEPVEWAEGLPIKVDAFKAPRYRK
jgi:DNA polymerase